MEVEWKETYEVLRQKHDEALKTIEAAKQHEEKGNADVALINYKLSISLIDEALATPVALPEDPDDVDDTWYAGLKIVKSLKRQRGDVMHHIAILSPSASESNLVARAASASNETASGRPRTFMELAEALQNFEYDFNDPKNLPSVLELLFSCESVKLYHINASGEVTTADESSTLRIIRLDQDVDRNLDATYFMQIIRSSVATEIQSERDDIDDENENEIVEEEIINALGVDGDSDDEKPSAKKVRENTPPKVTDSSLIYPLIPGVSPCFRTEYGAFIFPDIQSDVQGAAIGIVVPKSTDQIVIEILEAILHGIVRQKEEEEEGEDEEVRPKRYASDRISENIVQGACIISNGLVKGTEQLGKFVSYTTPYLISKLNKAPENVPPVPSKVANGIEIAKTATGLAVGVTGFVAGKVGSATVALGRFLAPHVHAQGSKLLSKSMGYSVDEAQGKVRPSMNLLLKSKLNGKSSFFIDERRTNGCSRCSRRIWNGLHWTWKISWHFGPKFKR